MQPIRFLQVNKTLGKPKSMTDEECGSLPVWTDGKECVSCWKMNWREKLHCLFRGYVWLRVISGSGTQPPVLIAAYKTLFVEVEGDADANS